MTGEGWGVGGGGRVGSAAAVSGNVVTFHTRTRFWREAYFVLAFATGNTTPELAPGSSREFSTGLKAYILAGTELEALFVRKLERTLGPGTSAASSRLQLELHWFL